MTKGLGQKAMITQGLGFWEKLFEEIRELITKVIKRFIPIERHPFETSFSILGSPVSSYSRGLPITGDTSHSKEISMPIGGSSSHPFSTIINTIGNLGSSIQQKLSLQGSITSKFQENLHCEGERDLRKILWTILDDE